MWNRVLLLATGLSAGWTLVNYWTVPAERMRGQLIRGLLSLSAGALTIGLLALSSVEAGATGLVVFLLTLAIAYAANAKQVSKNDSVPPTRLPKVGARQALPIAVFLVTLVEPPAYSDPSPFAQAFDWLDSRDEPSPHWLIRPLTYSRIRLAYRRMQENPPGVAGSTLAHELQERIGPTYRVLETRLFSSRWLWQSLRELAEEGLQRVTIIPLNLDNESLALVREQVTQSRVREIGLIPRITTSLAMPEWDESPYALRLQKLATGRAAAPRGGPRPRTLDELQALITQTWPEQESSDTLATRVPHPRVREAERDALELGQE